MGSEGLQLQKDLGACGLFWLAYISTLSPNYVYRGVSQSRGTGIPLNYPKHTRTLRLQEPQKGGTTLPSQLP